MWRAERKPWTLIDGDEEGGIYKTTNGGDDWAKLESGLPDSLIGRIGLALSPAQPDRVWAQVTAEKGKGGLYRTDDAGKTWKLISEDRNLQGRGWYYAHVTADPNDENHGLGVKRRILQVHRWRQELQSGWPSPTEITTTFGSIPTIPRS